MRTEPAGSEPHWNVLVEKSELADITKSPVATMSGLIRPSRIGPVEENDAKLAMLLCSRIERIVRSGRA
jgi:hypothetical protein